MGRLTNVQGIPIKCLECEDNGNCDYWCQAYDECAKKLKEYEDLEKEGLLLKLPCKVGDKAWYVRNCVIDEVEVDSFILNINLLVNVSLYVGYERFRKTLTPYKTLFFTRDEAEQKLEELKELSK